MSILTVPQRLAQVLVDADDNIRAAYYLTQNSIDQIERPCWLVFVEDASFPVAGNDQTQVEQAYSLAYIGQPFSTGLGLLMGQDTEYEVMARQVAENTVTYLLSHPQLQVANQRGLLGEKMGKLTGVFWLTVDGRSPVALYSRDAVEGGDAFWGFTLDITIIELMEYETVAF